MAKCKLDLKKSPSISISQRVTLSLRGYDGCPFVSLVSPLGFRNELCLQFYILTIFCRHCHFFYKHVFCIFDCNIFCFLFGRFHVLGFEEKRNYVSKWMRSHIEDGDKELKKPVMFTEYGLSNQNDDFQPSQREQFYTTILDIIYKSAKKKGSGAGSLIWQFFVEGMEKYNDDFGIVPWESPSLYKLTVQQSCRLARIQGLTQEQEQGNLKELCSNRERNN